MPGAPPGPKGEALGRFNAKYWRSDMFGFLATLSETYGDIAGFDMGQSPFILVNGAEHIRELFYKREGNLRKPEFVKDSNRGHWGDGLTTIDGAEWRPRRRILRPTFRAAPVADRLPVVAQLTQEMLDGWQPGTDIDLTHEFRLLTARIAARQVLDAELEGYGPPEGRSGVLPVAMAYGAEYTSSPGGDAAAPLYMSRPRAPRPFDAVTQIIDQRLSSREDRGDILTDLVNSPSGSGEKLDRDALVGEVMQMLYAGHLTMPFCLVNIWRDLAKSDARTKFETEAARLCAATSPSSGKIAASFGLAALKESMRLHPPAPILYREVHAPFELGGFEFERDTGVWVSPQLLQHDPRYYVQPGRFMPERFLGQSAKTPARGAYMPFGAGPRVCIASQQAFFQMALVCIHTASRFRLEPLPGPASRFNILAHR